MLAISTRMGSPISWSALPVKPRCLSSTGRRAMSFTKSTARPSIRCLRLARPSREVRISTRMGGQTSSLAHPCRLETEARSTSSTVATGDLIRSLKPPVVQDFAKFGASVYASADVTGDKRADIIVGAPGKDVNGAFRRGSGLRLRRGPREAEQNSEQWKPAGQCRLWFVGRLGHLQRKQGRDATGWSALPRHNYRYR